MIIMGVDPGGTTGLAWLDTDDQGYDYTQLEGPLLEQAEKFGGYVMEIEPDVIAIERFVLAPASGGRVAGILDAPRMIAMIEVWLHTILVEEWQSWKGEVIYQSAADAKGVMTNARLKLLGYEVRGEHAKDALRHALLAARKLLN